MNINVKVYGCYVIVSTANQTVDCQITSIKGFVGYDDIAPIRFFFFLSEQSRNEAITVLAANFCLCGALENTIDIEPKFENDYAE